MDLIRAYTGNEPFIFVSYAHKDNELIFPIIDCLVKDGYRVWYDEGIDPGSEFSDAIADKIYECEYFLAFISNNYLKSDYCKDELHLARRIKANTLILIYMEEVTLPSGMEMRYGRIQAIHKYTYTDENRFYEKLYSSKGLNDCKNVENVHAISETEIVEPVVTTPVDPTPVVKESKPIIINSNNEDESSDTMKTVYVVAANIAANMAKDINNRIQALRKIFIEEQAFDNQGFELQKQIKDLKGELEKCNILQAAKKRKLEEQIQEIRNKSNALRTKGYDYFARRKAAEELEKLYNSILPECNNFICSKILSPNDINNYLKDESIKKLVIDKYQKFYIYQIMDAIVIDDKTLIMGNYDDTDLIWHILDNKENSKLILSDKAFEEMKYCDDKNYDWDKSLPRKWIYNFFFHNALSVKQQDRVLFTDSEAAFGSNCDISDKAFILSKKEFDDYRDFIIKNKLHYCCDKKLRECNWWLRANEEYSRKIPFHVIAGTYATIGKSKEDFDNNPYLNTSLIAMTSEYVRPAMWIDIS